MGKQTSKDLASTTLGKSEHPQLLFLSFSYQSIQDILGITLPILALSLSASPFEIGLLATSRGVVYSVSSFMMGYVSDKVDSKRMMLCPMFVTIVMTLLFYARGFWAAFSHSIDTTDIQPGSLLEMLAV